MSDYTVRATFSLRSRITRATENMMQDMRQLFSLQMGQVLGVDGIPVHIEVVPGLVSEDYLDHPAAFVPDGTYALVPDGLVTDAAMDA